MTIQNLRVACAELDTGQDCCPVPDGQEPDQDRTSRPVDGHWSVPVPGTGLSIQAWTDGTRGWWHILPSLEIHERAQSLDDPELTGLLSYRYQKQQDAIDAGRQAWTLLAEQVEPEADDVDGLSGLAAATEQEPGRPDQATGHQAQVQK